jgi:hypothetical protein
MFMRLVLILMGAAFAVGGTAVVAWLAGPVPTAEVIAYGLVFALIAIGLPVTAGNLRSLF